MAEVGADALSAAATSGHAACLRILLDHPSMNANIRDTSSGCGWYLLHTAAAFANLEVVCLLAHSLASCRTRDDRGRTPLHCACDGSGKLVGAHRARVVRMLLDADREVIDWADSRGLTALHVAAENALEEVIEVLLRSGSKAIRMRTSRNKTPIQLVGNGKSRACQQTIEVLRRFGG